MLAELHGKFDPAHADSVDRSEDALTSAVFGAVRHLPRHVLGAVLAKAGIRVDAKLLRSAEIMMWPQMAMPRWGRVIEPDVVVVVGRQPIVFEAKLHSDFGKYPEPGRPELPALHQLAVQFSAVSEWALGKKCLPPIVVAVTAPPEKPAADLQTAAEHASRLMGKEPPTHTFRWLPWFKIAEVLAAVDQLEVHERALVSDALSYMEMRGVRRVFQGFQPEDYWLLAAAQRVAGERVYPQIQDFMADLVALLDDEGIRWSTADWRAMWMPNGLSISKPSDWRRGWLGALLWPDDWPTRQGKSLGYIAMYVIFDFVDPAVEIGLNVPGAGAGATQAAWPSVLPGVVSSVNSLGDRYELATDTGDMAAPTEVISAASVDVEWFTARASAMVSSSRLRLRRRVDPLTVTVVQVRDLLLELRRDVDAMGEGWWQLLRSTGYLKSEAPSSGSV